MQRLAVPASQVFPQFIKLAETWRGFQEETIILSRLDSLRRLLYDFTRCLAKLPYKRLAKKLGEEEDGRSAVSDEERNEVNSRGTINDEDFVADLISPGDVENYDDILLEFSGFCVCRSHTTLCLQMLDMAAVGLAFGRVARHSGFDCCATIRLPLCVW